MSCCTVKETSTNKYLEILKNNFDEVLIEKKERYQLLTLQDKANKINYDSIVWLQLKVAYSHTNSCNQNTEKKLEGVMKKICDWLPLLKDFEKSSQPKQLNLFGNEDEDELEEEPKSPSGENDKSWSKYFRDIEKVRKNNLMKKYSFFELFEDTGAWWQYCDIDYSKILPQTDEEMIELLKEYLSGEIHSEILKGNEPFEDEYNYLTRDGALSDIELYQRLHHLIRFELFPYKRYFHVYTDDSYTAFEIEENISHKLTMRMGLIEGSSWNNQIFPQYNFKDPTFLKWVREYFKIPFREVVKDEYVLKKNIEYFISNMLWYGSKEYDWKQKINECKNWKHFKIDINNFLKEKGIDSQNGGGSGFSLDGLDGTYDLSKKGNIKITQEMQYVKELNRNIDGLETEEWRDTKSIVVYNISGDEIYKKAFEFFNKTETINQISLFDFVA